MNNERYWQRTWIENNNKTQSLIVAKQHVKVFLEKKPRHNKGLGQAETKGSRAHIGNQVEKEKRSNVKCGRRRKNFWVDILIRQQQYITEYFGEATKKEKGRDW